MAGAAGAADGELLRRLRAVVGAEHVLDDPDVTAGYRVDWTGRYRGPPAPVVRPGSTAEVAEVVAACRERGVALVPQGGNTGMVGGGVPLAGELVVSLRRLRDLEPVDLAAAQVTAGAGVTVGEVHRHAAAAGLTYGVDLGSRDSATVGGTIATNAGGVRVPRYGMTRAQVVGIEAVLGDGSVVSHLSGLVRDNTGYHLPSLLCGSEGTLGVVTRARLRLVPAPRHRVTVLLAFDSPARAVGAVGPLRALPSLESAELFLRSGLELVCSVAGLPAPFPAPHGAYLLVELAGRYDPTDELAAVLGALPGLAASAVATEPARRAELWAYRERHTESINSLGPPHKLDVAVPLDRLAGFAAEVPGAVAAVAPGARTWLFGHVADGNLHVNVTGPPPDDDTVDGAVFDLVAAFGGSISAEHGIGTAKVRWLPLNRDPAELAAFRAVKAALDPAGICNPNVLLGR